MGEEISSSVSGPPVEFVYKIGDKLASKFNSTISSDDDLSSLPSTNLHGLWVFQTPSTGNKDSGDPTTHHLIKEYIAQYIGHLVQHLQLITSNILDILVQFWTPVTTIGRCFLASSAHPYGVSYYSDELRAYRKLSLDYKIYVDTETEKELGLIECAFMQKSIKLLPDVQSCSSKECPRLYHALWCNIQGFAALPMLGPSGLDCIGVVELAFAFRNIHPKYKSLTSGAVELKSPVDSDHFPSLNVTSGQEPVDKLSIEVIRSFMEEDIDCVQINQVTKYLPRTEGLPNETGMVNMDSSFDVEDEAINNVIDMIIVEDDAINNGDDAIIVEDDAISNGHEVIIVQETNVVPIDSEKGGHIKISQREYKKTETSISYEVLELHFGMKLKDAAEKLGVSRSKLKRMCRQNGIPRWPSHKRIEVNQPLSDQVPTSFEPSPDQTLQDGRTTTTKATYGDDIINKGDDMIIEEDNAISNKDGAIIVEDVAINDGDDAIIVEKWNTGATQLKKEGSIKISEREHTQTETSISCEVLERHFEMKLKDAAKKLGVSRSKLKRLCRQNGIPRWPSHKRNEANRPLSDQDPPSSELSPDQTLQDGTTATRKVTCGDDIINNGDDMNVVEDARYKEDRAIAAAIIAVANNGDDPVFVEKRNTVATHSKKEGNLKIAEREHKKTETSISYKVLEQHFGMKLEDAAKKLGVSRFKLTQLCRNNGIPRWPSYKRNEFNHPLSVEDPPSSEPSPEKTLRNGRTATIKATYGDDIIKFQLSSSARMADLEEEVGKRLKLMFGNFRIKYTDEDGDLILIACDADLANCMRMSLSVGMTTINMVVQPLTS